MAEVTVTERPSFIQDFWDKKVDDMLGDGPIMRTSPVKFKARDQFGKYEICFNVEDIR